MKKILEKYSKKPKGLFKLLFINFLFAYAPFALLIGVLSLFELVPVNFNDEKVYGIKGFIIIMLFIPFVAFILSFFTWLYFVIGNFFLNMFKKLFL
ncbi:hypothetical protein [Seonamhaeicola sp.]|uniref:hypothetical protein n=1 Tax=Seonamhaeicola sp. TaxID=1912245 RepID=UPI002624488B|nr:hypothetical protein [Seonamhaeicola sp.]